MNCTAIVLAAGQGKRMHSKVQKQFLEVGGYPILYYSLNCFEKSSLIHDVIVVTGKDDIAFVKQHIVDAYGFLKVSQIIVGGKERYDSVYAGLLACDHPDYVFIHDSARPFVTEEIVERGLEGAKKTGACVVGVPAKDTVKIADGSGMVASTPERSTVWTVQTPQVFSYDLIRRAHESIRKKNMDAVTDDSMVVEQESGVPVVLAEGSYRNIKITTPEDLLIAEAFLENRQENYRQEN